MRHLIRQFGYLLIAVLAGVYVYSALRGPQGLPSLRQKWNQVRQLELENQALREQLREKQERIRALRYDPEVQGSEVQKRSGKLQPGNRTFVLPGAKPQEAQAPASKGSPSVEE